MAAGQCHGKGALRRRRQAAGNRGEAAAPRALTTPSKLAAELYRSARVPCGAPGAPLADGAAPSAAQRPPAVVHQLRLIMWSGRNARAPLRAGLRCAATFARSAALGAPLRLITVMRVSGQRTGLAIGPEMRHARPAARLAGGGRGARPGLGASACLDACAWQPDPLLRFGSTPWLCQRAGHSDAERRRPICGRVRAVAGGGQRMLSAKHGLPHQCLLRGSASSRMSER